MLFKICSNRLRLGSDACRAAVTAWKLVGILQLHGYIRFSADKVLEFDAKLFSSAFPTGQLDPFGFLPIFDEHLLKRHMCSDLANSFEVAATKNVISLTDASKFVGAIRKYQVKVANKMDISLLKGDAKALSFRQLQPIFVLFLWISLFLMTACTCEILSYTVIHGGMKWKKLMKRRTWCEIKASILLKINIFKIRIHVVCDKAYRKSNFCNVRIF